MSCHLRLMPQTSDARSRAYAELSLDGASIDDLALDFTLPGYADIPLKVSRAYSLRSLR